MGNVIQSTMYKHTPIVVVQPAHLRIQTEWIELNTSTISHVTHSGEPSIISNIQMGIMLETLCSDSNSLTGLGPTFLHAEGIIKRKEIIFCGINH